MSPDPFYKRYIDKHGDATLSVVLHSYVCMKFLEIALTYCVLESVRKQFQLSIGSKAILLNPGAPEQKLMKVVCRLIQHENQFTYHTGSAFVFSEYGL